MNGNQTSWTANVATTSTTKPRSRWKLTVAIMSRSSELTPVIQALLPRSWALMGRWVKSCRAISSLKATTDGPLEDPAADCRLRPGLDTAAWRIRGRRGRWLVVEIAGWTSTISCRRTWWRYVGTRACTRREVDDWCPRSGRAVSSAEWCPLVNDCATTTRTSQHARRPSLRL